MRTPLQALGGHLGVALSRERDAAAYKAALQEALTQTARLSKLTGDLLLLNRLQTAGILPRQQLVDVAEMCDIALQRAGQIIEAQQLQVVEKWDNLEVEAAPSHVEILLGNLLKNAAKYAPFGAQIGVEIESSKRRVSIWNDCDKLQFQSLQKQVDKLSEPFYRPDDSRNEQSGGNGLGLAICHSIAEANNWTLEIALNEAKFCVFIEFCNK